MTCRPFVLICSLVLAVLAAGSIRAQDPETDAVAAARAWLAIVDAGEYAQSWDQAAEFFRGAVSMEQWQQMAGAARKPFGALISRELVSTQYSASLPGAPDGEYVVIQFATSFANKKSAIETVTPMKDSDGVWRVSGYYIK